MPRKKKNILKFFPKKVEGDYGKATSINGKDIDNKERKQNIGGVEFNVTPEAFTGIRPQTQKVKPNLSSLYEPLNVTIPSETTKQTILPEVVNKIEEPTGIKPIEGLLGTLLTTDPRYVGATPQFQEFSQRTIIPSLQQLYEGAKLKGQEQSLGNMLTPINPFRRSDQMLLQGLAGITASPFTTGQELLRDVPIAGEPIATTLDNIFESISKTGQVPTKTGFALAKALGIKFDPEVEQGLNELAGTIAQFVLPGKLGLNKVKGVFKDMKERMKKVSPTEQKLIIEQTKEDLQRGRIEQLKKIGEKKISEEPNLKPDKHGDIYTTKQPAMWDTQLNYERKDKYTPKYIYIAEVKNPSMEASYYGHETVSLPNEVKLVKNLGELNKFRDNLEAPLRAGELEAIREQYAKENNVSLNNVEFHLSEKGDIIKQPKPVNEVNKTKFKEQAIPKLDEWVNDAKSYEDFRDKVKRELVANTETVGRKLVDYGFVKDYATPDNAYLPFEQYYKTKKVTPLVKPIDTYLESLPKPTDIEIERAKKFVTVKRELNLNLNSVDTPYKLNPAEIRKGLNNIKDGLTDTKEARLVIDKINKAHEQGIKNNTDWQNNISENSISGEDLGKMTEGKPEVKTLKPKTGDLTQTGLYQSLSKKTNEELNKYANYYQEQINKASEQLKKGSYTQESYDAIVNDFEFKINTAKEVLKSQPKPLEQLVKEKPNAESIREKTQTTGEQKVQEQGTSERLRLRDIEKNRLETRTGEVEGQPEKNVAVTRQETEKNIKDFTESDVINRDFKILSEKLGEKKAIKYFQQADRLIDPNTNKIVEYRPAGIVTEKNGKYTFHPLMDMDFKQWRLASTKTDVTEQFVKPNKKPISVEKQPYEMTSNQFMREWYEKSGYKNKIELKTTEPLPRITEAYQKESKTKLQEHKQAVEQALSEGKTIPENVLKDYPELKGKERTPQQIFDEITQTKRSIEETQRRQRGRGYGYGDVSLSKKEAKLSKLQNELESKGYVYRERDFSKPPELITVEQYNKEIKSYTESREKIKEETKPKEIQTKLFTEQRHEEVINKLKDRRKGRLSAGLDPEELALMTEYLGYYVEKGIRTIPDITKQLKIDLGDTADYFLKNVDLKQLANLTPFNTHKEWLKGQEDVTLQERKNLGVTGKGDVVGAYTQKTSRGYTVTHAPYTPESSFSKEIGRIIANKIPDRLKDYQKDYNTLGFPHGLLKDRFAGSVKKLLANPKLREKAPELTKVLDKFDVPFTKVSETVGNIPEIPLNKTERVKASTQVEVTEEVGTYKSLKNLTSDTELNSMLDEIGQKQLKSRGGKISWEETEKNALELGLTVNDVKRLKTGEVVNSSFQEGIKQLAVDNAKNVADIVKESQNKKLSVQQAEKLKEAILTHNLLTAKMLNNVSEAGRVLNIMKKGVEPREFDTLQKAADILRKSGVDISDPVKINKKLVEILKPSFYDKAVFYWYNSLLSNPLTDVANITGNLGYLSSEVITRSIWEPEYTGSIARGFGKGLKDAKIEIAGILKAERESISKYDFDTHKLKELYDPNPNNVQNKLLRKIGFTVHAILPTTRLRIEDALFRNIAKNMEREVGIKQLTKTEKQNKAVIEQNLKLLEDSIKNKDLAKLTEQEQRYYRVIQDYEKYARELTFIEPLGKTGEAFQKLSNSNPFLKWTFPFIRIAINLTKEGMKHTPLYIGDKLIKGQWSDISPRAKIHLIRRGIVGTAVMSGLLVAMQNGKVEITGDGPANRTKRDLWLKSGYKPNHIYIGNTGIPYTNINPFNIILSVMGNISDYVKYDTKFNNEDNDIINKSSLVLGKVANTFLSNSFMQGAENLLRAFQDGDPNLLSKVLTSPLPNVGGIIRGFKGEYPQYQKATFWDYLNFKLGTGGLKQKIDIYGEPKESPYRRFFFQMSDKRVNEIAGYLLDNNINVGMPTRPNIKGIEATDEQYNKYLEKSGQSLKNNLSRYFVKIKTYDKEFQDDIIKRVAEISRDEALKEIEEPNYKSKADKLIKDEIKWRSDFYRVNGILKKYDLNYTFSDDEKEKGKFDMKRFKRLYLGGDYTTPKGYNSHTNGRINDIKQGKGQYKNMPIKQRRNQLQNTKKAFQEIMQ